MAIDASPQIDILELLHIADLLCFPVDLFAANSNASLKSFVFLSFFPSGKNVEVTNLMIGHAAK